MFLLPRGLAAGPFLWSVLRRLARAVTLPRAVVRFECSRALRDDDGRFLNPRASLPFRWWRKNLWPNNRPGSCVVLELDCAVWPPRSALLNGYAVLHVLGLLVAECQVFKPGLLAPCVALPRDGCWSYAVSNAVEGKGALRCAGAPQVCVRPRECHP